MIARIIMAAMLASTLVACGVKTELDRPDGHMMRSDENDPSKPPHPLGEGNGGEDMPFPTGP